MFNQFMPKEIITRENQHYVGRPPSVVDNSPFYITTVQIKPT